MKTFRYRQKQVYKKYSQSGEAVKETTVESLNTEMRNAGDIKRAFNGTSFVNSGTPVKVQRLLYLLSAKGNRKKISLQKIFHMEQYQ